MDWFVDVGTVSVPRRLFDLGRVQFSHLAFCLLEERKAYQGFLRRHAAGDWGLANHATVERNRKALRCGGGSLTSEYVHDSSRFVVVTDERRETTTFLVQADVEGVQFLQQSDFLT